METGYPKSSFDNLFTVEYECSEADKFIGQGNPAAKILIVAKEWGMNMTDPNSDQKTIPYIRGIKDNFSDWRDKRHPSIKDWFECGWDWNEYHPLQPYKGQVMVLDNKNPDIHLNNRGTSATWLAYQRFINELLPAELKVLSHQQLNFYNYCFITELSSYPMPMSRKKQETQDSINARIINPKGILRKQFFKEFPVIILSCYKYIDQYHIPIIDCFNDDDTLHLNYEYKGIIVSQEGYKGGLPLYNNCFSNYPLKKGEFINVHEGIDCHGKKHLMLHTSHFQMKTNAWIKALAKVVQPYLAQ